MTSAGSHPQWTRETQALYCQRKTKFLTDDGYFDFASLLETVIQRRLRPPGIRYLFADEAQDNSPLLWTVLELWAEGCEKFVCLGDPLQCIYSTFLPASPEHFLRFINSARRIDLKQSYRLPRKIQAVSEAWISQNGQGAQRLFLPRPADGTVKGFCQLEDFDWGDLTMNAEGVSRWRVFVLARTRWQAGLIKDWFTRNGIPYAANRGRSSPLQSSVGRLAYALILLAEGEPVRAEEMLGVKSWLPVKPWFNYGSKTEFLRAAASFPDQLVDRKFLVQNGFTSAFLEILNSRDFLHPLKIHETDKAYLRRCYDRFGRNSFTRSPSVLVTNIHGVKGMEADWVVIDPNLRGMPAQSFDEDPAEERRVGYVGITRAREALYVLAPDRGADAFYDFKVCKTAGEIRSGMG